MVAGLPLSERNLILTGYTGPNQPSVGREIATRLRMPYVDIESLIEERTGETLETIRQLYGVRRLRAIESEILEETALHRRALIRVSGSALLHSDHFERLEETGPVICLVANLDAILQRMHLALGARFHNPAERAHRLGQLKREWAIREQPGIYEIDTTYLSDEEAVAAAIALWQSVAISRG